VKVALLVPVIIATLSEPAIGVAFLARRGVEIAVFTIPMIHQLEERMNNT
jgi:hypothetical protein